MGCGEGCDGYAHRQADAWRRMADWASAEFGKKADVRLSWVKADGEIKPNIHRTSVAVNAVDEDVKPIIQG